MSNAEMSFGGLPPEGQFNDVSESDGQTDPTIDQVSYDDRFTPQEMVFATQQAVDRYETVLRQEFGDDEAPTPAADSDQNGAISDSDIALGPVGTAKVALYDVSHEITVQAMPGSLAGPGVIRRESLTNPGNETDDAPGVSDIGFAKMDDYAHAAGRDADIMAYERAAERPAGLNLQDATVSLAGIRHAITTARAERSDDAAIEERRLSNAAGWVMERTVANPEDVALVARMYDFVAAESDDASAGQPDTSQRNQPPQ